MKVMISHDQFAEPLPLLTMFVHGCPHKRVYRPYLQKMRDDFTHSVQRQLRLPFIKNEYNAGYMIDYPVDISVTYTNPMSEDLDHLMEALYMIMDGPSGSLKGPSVLKDDRLIKGFSCRIYYPEDKTKRETERW